LSDRPRIKNEAISSNLLKFRYPLIACELICIENTNANLTELFLPERPIFIEKKEIEEVEEEVEV
jgi:hypothetical protein